MPEARFASVPSSFRTSSPAAQINGHQVKTPQPPQLPPKKVPSTPPPSASTARACRSHSRRVAGGLSGSSFAFR
ncbi:hypothetical protein [Streptomyces afghaniensis]|uniref:hypothetical protein n=1 Tax=Streptomyces afghaniensis TaxID=66865 RepID=UPI00246925B4|nr:hypothetical protein [Streptomyces afghaniensis]